MTRLDAPIVRISNAHENVLQHHVEDVDLPEERGERDLDSEGGGGVPVDLGDGALMTSTPHHVADGRHLDLYDARHHHHSEPDAATYLLPPCDSTGAGPWVRRSLVERQERDEAAMQQPPSAIDPLLDEDLSTPVIDANGFISRSTPPEVRKKLQSMKLDIEDGSSSESSNSSASSGKSGGVCWIMVMSCTTMLFANLLNYTDRYTIAGVLLQVQDYYDISNAEIGLLQTAFICSYMVFSPIFGFLGDRYNRKIIMAIGIGLWSIVTFFSSFVPQQYFGLFLFARALVGIGEASYSTIAPTIIADLFVGDARTKALSVFYFAIPIGSGLGYIVGSYVAKLMGSWQWALRVTPALGILCVIMILLFVREPTRGALEGGTHLRNTSWFADLAYLVKNKSFMMSTFGFTCVAFVAGALALWTPTYVEYSIIMIGEHIMESSTVSLIFGVITCLAGFIGVAVGSESARRLRKRCERADPLVCAFGLLGSGPFVFLAVFMSRRNTIAAWIMVFLAETLLCLNWALVTDILLYIVIPTRRSTAEAVQILVSHALGDAGSPYLVGAVSDHLRKASGMPIWSTAAKASSLQNSMYIPCFVSVLGGGFFLFTALFILDDRRKAKEAVGVVNGSVSSSQSGLSTETATTETASSIQGNRSSVDKPTTVNA